MHRTGRVTSEKNLNEIEHCYFLNISTFRNCLLEVFCKKLFIEPLLAATFGLTSNPCVFFIGYVEAPVLSKRCFWKFYKIHRKTPTRDLYF